MTAGPDDGALPIKVDPTSNGEFRPVPLAETVARANALALERIGEHAERVGVARRTFLRSLSVTDWGEVFQPAARRRQDRPLVIGRRAKEGLRPLSCTRVQGAVRPADSMGGGCGEVRTKV